MSRIAIPDTAFRRSTAKRPREERPDHLAWIRTLPCVVTGQRPAEAAHIRYGNATFGKRETGMGEKPDDKWTVPLHHSVHMAQHAAGEREWWRSHDINPLLVALLLWDASGDDERAAIILREARQ